MFSHICPKTQVLILIGKGVVLYFRWPLQNAPSLDHAVMLLLKMSSLKMYNFVTSTFYLKETLFVISYSMPKLSTLKIYNFSWLDILLEKTLWFFDSFIILGHWIRSWKLDFEIAKMHLKEIGALRGALTCKIPACKMIFSCLGNMY